MKPTSQTRRKPGKLLNRWTIVNGLRIHAICATAPRSQPLQPIVLVHGLGMSHRYFVPLAKQLAGHADVYLPNLPGHGQSEADTAGDAATTVAQLADRLLAWMDAVGLARACLVGNSMGAQIVADAAVRYQERVSALALIGPTVDPQARSFPALLWRLLRTSLHEDVALLPILLGDYLRVLPRLAAEYRLMLADSPEQKLPRLRRPLLVLRGENDFISPPHWTRQLSAIAPHSVTTSIPRAAHAAHFSKPAEAAQALITFLKQCHSIPQRISNSDTLAQALAASD